MASTSGTSSSGHGDGSKKDGSGNSQNSQDSSKKEQYVCEQCGRLWASKKRLSRHIRESHAKPFHCSLCPARFGRPSLLSNHMKVHAKKDKNPDDHSKKCKPGQKAKSSSSKNSTSSSTATNNNNNNSSSITRSFDCNECSSSFSEYQELVDHFHNSHGAHQGPSTSNGSRRSREPSSPQDFHCTTCDRIFTTLRGLRTHEYFKHRPRIIDTDLPSDQDSDSSSTYGDEISRERDYLCLFDSLAREYTLEPESLAEEVDLGSFFSEHRSRLIKYLMRRLRKQGSIKFYMSLSAQYNRLEASGTITSTISHHTSKCITLLAGDDEQDVEDRLLLAIHQICTASDAFSAEGSGWALHKIIHLKVYSAQFRPLRGGCR